MEPHAQHVHAEPGEARDDVAEDGHGHDAALPGEAAPARVQDDGVPEHDEQRPVLLGVPAPEAAPGLVGPDAAQDRADEAEEEGEGDDAVDHPGERLRHLRVHAGGRTACAASRRWRWRPARNMPL